MPPRVSIARRVFLKSAILLGLAPATGRAQAQPDDGGTATLEAPVGGPIGMGPFFSVTRVDPAGTARLRISPNFPADLAKFVSGITSEGYYLLLAPIGDGSGRFDVLRAQVTEVEAGPECVLAISPEAAAKLKVGPGYSLVRPFGATTALMRGLPGIIPFSNAAGDLADSAQFARRAQSINNLKQIGLAMHNFQSSFGRFPAAVIHGPDGKPWHSWRVLILPYLEQAALFNEYDFNEPWNSEKNRKLIPRMPSVYREPAYGPDKGSFTNYAGLVGPRAFFPPQGAKQPSNVGATVPMGEGGRRIAELTDGTSNTWAVAPVAPGLIPWTKPEDIEVGQDFPGLGKAGGIATPYTLGCVPGKPGVAPILYVDGSVSLISATINPAVLNALLTYNGGEVISADAVPRDSFANQPNRMLKIRIVGKNATATVE
jgi:Protein of unknown function (DUF1559)